MLTFRSTKTTARRETASHHQALTHKVKLVRPSENVPEMQRKECTVVLRTLRKRDEFFSVNSLGGLLHARLFCAC